MAKGEVTGSDKPDNALDFFLANLADSLDPNSSSGSLIWEPQKGPQTMAYDSLAHETFYGGAAGGGKFLHIDSLTLTPFSWKKVSDINVGDMLVAYDGTPTKVLAVYPHKDKDLYRFTFIDGASVIVSDDHLWAYWRASDPFKGTRTYLMYDPVKGIHHEEINYKIGLAVELYEYHQKQVKRQEDGKRPYWLITPLCEPIRFTRPSRTRQGDVIRIEPYLLGLLLGDGSITETGINITTIDGFVKEYVESISSGDVTWDGVKHLNFKGSFKKELEKQLTSYDLLGTKSHNKFIPENYLFASIQERIDLLAGLVDTDGYVDERGHIEYVTISEQLAKDVQHLARSLGAKATINTKVPTYTYEGERLEGQLAYVIYIQGGEITKQFSKMPRKRDRIKSFNGGVSESGRRIVDIEYVGKGDGVCFAIDHPSGLHVVQDFIVTHNSDLLLGWATTRAYKSIIYRREYSQMSQLIDRSKEILFDTSANYNANTYTWNNIPGGRMLRFASVPHAESVMKYQGRPHDFIGFDEVTNFLYAQYIFLLAWNRTENPNARPRVIGAGNPPTNVEGEWVVRRWAPWLDRQYGNPAEPGELRWFVTLDDKEEEVEDDSPIKYKDELFYPTSRTYIPATLDDNKYYGAEYRARLQSMPVELRSKFLYGDFGIVFKDDPFQVIPSDFVKIGQERWHDMHNSGKLDEIVNVNPAYGLDPSEAGDDKTMLAHITINAVQWVRGTEYTDLMEISNWTMAQMGAHKFAPIGVDAIGVGAGVYYRLRQMRYKASGLKVSSKTNMRDRTGNMQFLNLRAYLWWLIRDALDPHGLIQLAIPPDVELERELLAPRWRMTETGLVQVDKNVIIRERLGRSPDKASALMMCLYVSHVRRPQLRII